MGGYKSVSDKEKADVSKIQQNTGVKTVPQPKPTPKPEPKPMLKPAKVTTKMDIKKVGLALGLLVVAVMVLRKVVK